MTDGTCSVADCDRRAYCKGWCEPHYRKWRKYGDPLTGKFLVRLAGTPEQRFWPRVDKNGPIPEHRPELGSCWLWTTTASTTNGYPQFRCGDRMVLAYRYAYEATKGLIPDGLQLDHVCHNQSPTCPSGPNCLHRKCVNPEHLEPVTNIENSQRRVGMHYAPLCPAKLHPMVEDNVRITSSGLRICRECSPGRRADVHLLCPHGHERTPENRYVQPDGRLACRVCKRDSVRRHRAKPC